jgi:hypothetical protein
MNFRLITICLTTVIYSSCGEPISSSETRGANFSTLKGCMSGLDSELGGLKIVIDKPDNVSGRQPDGTIWACTKETSGTKGTYWEGYYTFSK